MWQLAANTHGNSDDIDSSRPKLRQRCCMCDKNLWQLAMKVCHYCHGGQNAIFFPTNYRRNCDDGIKFKKKITQDMVLPYYIVLLYTILQCNMALPYYIVIWHYHITL